MAEFNWVTALLGGVLIGLSATLLLAFNGRIAGISGMVNGAMTFKSSERWRWLFLAGIVIGGTIYEYLLPLPATPHSELAPLLMLMGGLLVGVGTRLGNGCTSGHGVCGLGRLSARSLAAVCTFLITAMVTVFVVRHGVGV